MACEASRRRGQSLATRILEVKQIVKDVDSLIASKKIKVVVDKRTGAVAFQGLDDTIRDGATDACIVRRLMSTGSSLTKMAILQAEQLAGRSIDKQTLAAGVHSHDGGTTWHSGH